LKNIIQSLDLELVPILSEDYLLENNIPDIVEKAKIKTTLNPKSWAEGIVIRPLIETADREFTNELEFGGRLSFKVINPEFLLKFGE
jgi:hypothetical protein